ncbi:putative type VI secretion system effector, Hcp1 family [Pseudomonas syringae pv. pisi]|uniref:SciM protein n=3 Tax=Pseudomonas syringae group TaxID=136849 RepID=F3GFE5_PSESJ|nr:type VI secretion system tube protein Hcp [Pseudomonas syringae]EGH45795.1 SciM protein [Pseudomonas syringae pv. pisi str. 1704B]PYD14319.1 Hcp1 family type VI secretion system effector [Pseudomonas syringae pv. pisi]RMU92350.1 putative type VI secretion system effector, Hcp1 family [Pseudomonas savastanoi pv. phaseolicola]PYD32114.1 Hcp1 family type VI secretion system effector [Pseudomonas syringae pv. pisi]PYD34994.1 Hcp1 family type VI secretion system effector [Pseudomonas syringae pv
MSFDAFMTVDGVEGESLDDGHKGWVELLSYQYSAMQSISQTASSNGGAIAGAVLLGDFQISKYVDRAIPKLFYLY